MYECGKSVGNWRRCAVLALLAAALLVPAAALNGAEIKRIYPPYPDVWGRMLPFPNDGRYDDRDSSDRRASFFMSAYEGPKGRVVYRILSGSDSDPQVHGHHIFDFFTGKFRTLMETTDFKATQKFQWPHSGSEIDYHKIKTLVEKTWGIVGWEMPSGNRLLYVTISRFTCRHEWNFRLFEIRRSDYKGPQDILAEKILIALFPKPALRRVPLRCRTGRKEDAFYSAKWRQLSGVFAPLKDGTFLFSHHNSPIIIRFRRDFTSPYIEANPDLFLIDRAAYLKALGRAAKRPGPLSQNVDDAVYDYLMTLK